MDVFFFSFLYFFFGTQVIVADNFFTGSKDNLRKWIGHPRFELIRHGTSLSSFVVNFVSIEITKHLFLINYFTVWCSKELVRIIIESFTLLLADVTEPLLVEVDRIYHLACPASPIFYKHNPVKVCILGIRVITHYYLIY